MSYSVTVEITAHRKKSDDLYRLDLYSPEISREVQPGQFLHLRVRDGGYDPLLRRPFSIYDWDGSRGIISIMYRVVGRGTGILAQRPAGDKLDIMGPLGRPFTLWEGDRKVIVVAGGVGMAPLYPLVKAFLKKDVEVEVLLGARTEGQLVGIEDLQELKINPHVATQDGSTGFKGLVTDLLKEKLEENSFHRLYTCGPRPMLEEVARVAGVYQLKGEVSLEELMACGVGACLGCVCPVKDGEGRAEDGAQKTLYKKICAQGPAFSLEEVF